MISKDHYLEIVAKYSHHASWAVWADQGETPKSNMGDISIFDVDHNPDILNLLNPNVIMVGLNFSRKIDKQVFVNFHDKNPNAQDFKLRHAFKNTEFYGAYMTDVIKDFEHLISGKVVSFLRMNKEFEKYNIELFKQELNDIKSVDPLIIAFGEATYKILMKYFAGRHKIIKVPHYSMYISMENYRIAVHRIMGIV